MKKLIFLFLILMAAQSAFGQKLTTCDIGAAINNQGQVTTDPTGTNVRSGPGKDFSIVKTLKDESGFIFHITASQGNWVRIDSVHPISADSVQHLVGWVYAPSLFLKAEHEYGSGQESKFVFNLYAAPDWKARLLLSKEFFDKNGEYPDNTVSLRGCQGKWAKVAWKETIGWLNPASQCADFWDPCGEM